jgi:hypothetical protein
MRVLVAAGDAASRVEDVPSGVRLLVGQADAVYVMSPALPKRLQWLTSETDEARAQGQERLQAVVNQIRKLGSEVAGAAVGSDDPLIAFDDAVAEFQPDHIVIALRSSNQAAWQESGLIERVHERYHLPITLFDFG